MTKFTHKVGDRVRVLANRENTDWNIGLVGTVIAFDDGDAVVSFAAEEAKGRGWSYSSAHEHCWYFFDPAHLEAVRPEWTMRDVNGVNIVEGDKIVYVTRRGSWMQMIPAVVLSAGQFGITVRRTTTAYYGQDPDRKIVLTKPSYIAITEKADA